MMRVSVIVPAYNEEKYIASCLKAIVDQTTPADEIIVVNNNSTDATAEIVATFPQVTLINEPKQGMIPARNKGFDTAIGDIIARTDADTKVPNDWVEKIKKRFTEDPDLQALSGPARFEALPKAVQPKNWLTVIAFNATYRRTTHHDVLFGPNMAIRKSMWKIVKNEVCLDDKIVHEDMDLALHIGKKGKILFDETLVVISSLRRWKKLTPYIEYPYRYMRTIQHHNPNFQKSSRLVKKMIPHTKKFFKRLSDATSL